MPAGAGVKGPSGGSLPVQLVQGDDQTLVTDAIHDLIRNAGAEPGGLGVEELSGDDVGVSAIVDACLTPPFLSEQRIVVARDIGRFSTAELAPLVDYLDDPLPTTLLLLATGGGRTASSLLTAVKKVGRVVDAAIPATARARTTWLTERLADGPVRLDAAAGELLGRHLGEDMGRLGSLLDVLAAAYGDGASVGVADLEPFLGEAGGGQPWDLTDAIDAGDVAGALAALDGLVGPGRRHPLVVLATLQRHFGAMLRLDGAGVRSEDQAAALLGIKPYPAKKAMAQGRRLGSSGIGRAIVLLAEADLALRGATGWPEGLVLEVLVARLARLTRAARSTASTSPRTSARSRAAGGATRR